MSPRIEHAEPGDLTSIITLLDRCGLPEAGLGVHMSTLLFTAKQDGRLLGCAAVELYGRDALLRSLAVAEDARGRGLGDRLVQSGLDAACRLGVTAVYLLTDTAEAFFARRGFGRIERAEVPAALTRSAEFSYAGCSDAAVMVRRVADPAHRSREEGVHRLRSMPGVSLRDLAATLDRFAPPDVEIDREPQCASCG
jgi:amino-acid N-acetyltransferase